MAIPWASLGLDTSFALHIGMLYEGAGYESTFASVPASSHVDGAYDPDYGTFLRFDRTSIDAPADHASELP
jgi:hypothetical protein